MHLQLHRRSSLFLLELILAIFFFILTAALCVRIFVSASLLEDQSAELNHAVAAASSAAEVIRSQEDPLTALTELFPEGDAKGSTYTVYYDSVWSPCDFHEQSYQMEIVFSSENSFLNAEISLQKEASEDPELYQLTIQKYLP